MATIDGARALGLDADVGSLERGKKADLVVVRLGRLHTTPATDVVSALVYSSEVEDVDTVIIDGRLLMRERKLLTIDEPETIAIANSEAQKLLTRAGV
jgi:cytosine/adenosine deaminase-related metal-dependent hydrolase